MELSGEAIVAIKKYRKALEINPQDSESGESLCELLQTFQKQQLVQKLCEAFSLKSPDAIWAWKRLGLMHIANEDWANGITCLQNVLRVNSRDSEAWEAIAWGYHRLGRLTTASKAYERSIETKLNPGEAIFASIQLGYIQLRQGHYIKANATFDHVLILCPATSTNFSLIWGKSCALLGKAKEVELSGAIEWALDLLYEAELLALQCTKLPENNVTCWKLLGDVLFQAAKLTAFNPEKSSCLAKKAAHWLKKRLHFDPANAEAYSDLALALQLCKLSAQTTANLSETTPLASREPVHLSLCSLRISPQNSEFWTVLGAVSAVPSLAQHCLIRAIQLDRNGSAPWAALGKLYGHHDRELSRRAYEVCREKDPLNALAWQGIAIAGFLESNLEEAFLCSLQSERYQSAFPNALLLSLLHLQRAEPHNAEVLTAISKLYKVYNWSESTLLLFALVAESFGLLRAAMEALQTAKKVLPPSSHKASVVSTNLARVYLKAGHTESACREFEPLAANGHLSSLPSHWSIFALALWKSGDPNRAMAASLRALQSKPYLPGAAMVHSCLKMTNTRPILACLPPTADLAGMPAGGQGLVLRALAGAVCQPGNGAGELAQLVGAFGSLLPQEASKKLLAISSQDGKNLAELAQALDDISADISGTSKQSRNSLRVQTLRKVLACPHCGLGKPHSAVDSADLALTVLKKFVRMNPADFLARYALVRRLMLSAAQPGSSPAQWQACFRLSTALAAGLRASGRASWQARALLCHALLCASECLRQQGRTEAGSFAEGAETAAKGAGDAALASLARCQRVRCQVAFSGWLEKEPSERGGELSLLNFSLLQKSQGRFEAAMATLSECQALKGKLPGSSLQLLRCACLRGLGSIDSAVQEAALACQLAESDPKQCPAVALAFHGSLCLEQPRNGAPSVLVARRSLLKSATCEALPGVPLLLGHAEVAAAKGKGTAKFEAQLSKELDLWSSRAGGLPGALLFERALSGLSEGGRVKKKLVQIALHLNPVQSEYRQHLLGLTARS